MQILSEYLEDFRYFYLGFHRFLEDLGVEFLVSRFLRVILN